MLKRFMIKVGLQLLILFAAGFLFLAGTAYAQDLEIQKTDSPDPVYAGQDLTYGVTVTNQGASSASNVVVTDTLPAEVTHVGDTAGCVLVGSSPDVLQCSLGDVAAGDSIDFEIKAYVAPDATVSDPDGTITIDNVAEVGSDSSDPNPANNTITETTFVQNMADLRITKFVSPHTPVLAGEQFTYTIIVDNLGPSTSYNIVVTDTLVTSAGVDANGCSIAIRTDGGAIDEFVCNFALSTGVFDLGTFGSNWLHPRSPSDFGRIIITINATADGNVDLSNMATVTSDTFDPDLSNNISTLTHSVTETADLRIVKFVSPHTPVLAGEQFTYTILVDNLGPSTAYNIVVTDTLVTSAAVDPNGCSIAVRTDGGAIDEFVCNFAASLGVFDLGTFGSNWLHPRSPSDFGRIIITINATANGEVDLSNFATVTSNTFDPNLSNNYATLTHSVQAAANLKLTKTASSASVAAGEQLQYTLRVTNTGPSTAENVFIEDALPAEVEVISVAGLQPNGSPAGCSAGTPGDPLDLTTCDFGGMAAGRVATMTVVVWVKPDVVTDPVTDQKIIHNDAWAYSDTFDTDLVDNRATLETTVQARADLDLSKFAVGTPRAGTDIHYEYQIDNLGPSVSRDVTLRDFLPDEVEFLSAYVDAEGSEGGVPLPCSITIGSNALFCPLGDISPTDGVPIFVFVNVHIKSDVPGSTAITNSADVFLTDTPDPNPTNNSDSTTVTVLTEADLEIEKWSEPAKVYAGEQKKYTISVYNVGPSDVQNVVVTDTLPVGLEYEIDTDNCSVAGTGPSGEQILTCTNGTLGANETWQFDIWAQVDPATLPGTELVNEACVAGETTLGDPNPDNDCATARNLVMGKADLQITKFGKPDDDVRAGENLTYTVVVENLGPGYAHSVVITDLIQSDGSFELVSVDSDRPATCAPTSGVYSEQLQLLCTLTDPLEVLAPDASGRWIVTVVLEAQEAQTINNVARVVSEDYDPNPEDNVATVQHEITAVADLAITKAANGQVMGPGGTISLQPDQVTAGLSMTYTLVITNQGPSTAENVVIKDQLPSWFEITGATSSQGSCGVGIPGEASDEVTCNLDSLAPGASAWARLFIDVPSSTPAGAILKNTAFALSDVFDPHNGDNVVTNMTTVDAWADLWIEKVQDPAIVLPGEEIEYTVTIRNDGPSDATNALFEDAMPQNLVDASWECLSYDDASCAPAGSGDIYRNVDLPVSGMLIYTIQAMRFASAPQQTVVNTATVAPPASASDPDMSNNSDSAINTTVHVYLPIVKTPDRTLPVGPDLVVSEIQAASNGIILTIENQGNAPVSQPFWVDAYIDPDIAPDAVQQVWSDLGSQGLVWGIPEGSLPFLSGETLTLSVGDAYYWPSLSHATWPLPAGTPVYAQVDSSGKHDYGAVEEDHEQFGGFYNNISGPVSVEASQGPLPEAEAGSQSLEGLPYR